jgi:predicted phosphodiesterase
MKFALITDIHEDIVNLEEAFRKIEKNAVDEVICLGDISGFSAPHYNYLRTRNAHECLSLIRKNCKYIVIGNHDMHAAHILPKNCTFFDYPDNWYSLDYHQRHRLGSNVLWLHEEYDLNPLYKEEDLKFLKTLPETLIVEEAGFNILLSHYVYPNITGLKKEFYTYGDEFKQHFDFMDSKNCQLSFTGHSHIKGFFAAYNNHFKTYKYRRTEIPFSEGPVCIGIPPVTSNGRKSGIAVFDTDSRFFQVIRL